MELKKCLRCKKDLHPRPYTSYKRLKFCSTNCNVILRGEMYPIYSVHKKAACEVCGATKGKSEDEFNSRLVVHHIDDNMTNNDPSNLQTLCKECHNGAHKKGVIGRALAPVSKLGQR